MTVSERLKIIQKASGLTQEKLAAKLGVSFVAFNNWITGKATPRPKALARIDALYRSLTGEREVPREALIGKKALVGKAQRAHRSVVREILSRRDLYDEFLLALTYHSNRIEGSALTENETAAILFENAALPNRSLAEQLEVKNHQAALEYLFREVRSGRGINEGFILQLHRILMNSVDSAAGSYRRHGVRILGTTVPTANYLSVPRLMKALVRDIRARRRDVISLCAEIHSQFEQIHPFADGNGRVGRLLMHAMLLKQNIPPAVIRQEKRRAYLKSLNVAQMDGDHSLLEDFVCDAVLEGFDILNG
mgnify:CR=1 FL=1